MGRFSLAYDLMVTSPRFVSSVFAQASAPLLVTPAIAKALQPLNALSCHQANPQDSPPLTLAHSLRADPLANLLPNPQDGPPRSLLHSLLAVPRRNRVVSPQACPLVCPVDSLLQCHQANQLLSPRTPLRRSPRLHPRRVRLCMQILSIASTRMALSSV